MKSRTAFSVGITFITVATLLILSLFGYITPSLSPLLITWQTLLIVIGLITLLNGNHFLGGPILILVGGYFLLPKIYEHFQIAMPLNHQDLITLFVAVLLIVIGLSVLFRKRYQWDTSKYQAFNETRTNRKGVREISCVFGEANHVEIDRPFKGAEMSTAFGSATFDLSATTLNEGESVLQVDNAFGETTLIIPSNWNVKVNFQTFAGSVNDQRTDTSYRENAERTLRIDGNVAFGTIKLVSSGGDNREEAEESETNETIETISVKQNNKVLLLTLDEIHFIQADGDYVTLCTAQGKFLKEQTMKYFQNALPADRFLRIHRSSIVNLNEISSVESRGKESYYVTLKDGTALRASISGYQQLKEKLNL